MIRFELKKVIDVAGTSREVILREISLSRTGPSFLINFPLLAGRKNKHTDEEILQYLILASYRDYGKYKALGITYLDADISPLPIELLKTNKALKIINNRIYFLYEEQPKRKNPNGTKFHRIKRFGKKIKT